MVYTGKQDPTTGLGHTQAVVMDLADSLLGCHRTVVVGNFFASVSLAKSLLRNDTYLIGTLRSKRAGSEHEVVQKKLKHGEIYALQSNNGIKLIKWKDKRDVLMISTKSSHSATLVDTEKINKANEFIMKPQVIIDYNQEKQVGFTGGPHRRERVKKRKLFQYDERFDSSIDSTMTPINEINVQQKRAFSVQATSAPIERAFSPAGIIISP
ncbi:unnamed protein product [Rotaria magnacalcarata]|nr:unnamed protein product [Rotaria magnacalcarata]CAF1599479.1 unnamed protein product [Rotaria magnacalcarata]CAF2094428.1 unnamed protein product [Rotaria magnacalcarata]CAF2147760.1 unnamed protein product [Rotaria magnacalcarata]CAF3846697.1 unnamed protein product [Rotaria magnacalcarata]